MMEKPDSTLLGALNEILPRSEKDAGTNQLKLEAKTIEVDRENVDASYQQG